MTICRMHDKPNCYCAGCLDDNVADLEAELKRLRGLHSRDALYDENTRFRGEIRRLLKHIAELEVENARLRKVVEAMVCDIPGPVLNRYSRVWDALVECNRHMAQEGGSQGTHYCAICDIYHNTWNCPNEHKEGG